MSKTFPSVLTVYFFVPVFLFGQYDTGNRYTALSSEKPVTDYFDNVDDKSFYQRQRIHGMKREINDYSERLHNLQSRFDEIFYGLSRGNSFSKPFNTEINPTRPAKKDLYEPRSRQTYESLAPKGSLPQVSVEQGQFYSPPSDSSALFEPQEQNPVNQLAFQVEAPGTYTEDGKTKALFNPSKKILTAMFPFPELYITKTPFFPRTIRNWNSLPCNVKASTSLSEFTAGLANVKF